MESGRSYIMMKPMGMKTAMFGNLGAPNDVVFFLWGLEYAIWQFVVVVVLVVVVLVVLVVLVGMVSSEFIDELLHCRQVSGTPQPIHFLKAHDVN